jgi:pseudouridine-5'-phosphate glycosidase
VQAALDDAARRGITGGAITPHLLRLVAGASDGRALRANIGLILSNARAAAAIAVALESPFEG